MPPRRFEARLACFYVFNAGGTASIAHTQAAIQDARSAIVGGSTRVWVCFSLYLSHRSPGNDRFILLMFIPAISIDDLIIPNLELRAAILSALEAASVLELLLRAEALTTAGLVTLYAASRRFLDALKNPVFLDQQTSAWAIPKFHMLMHCINCAGLL